jgi:hypothetical protein
MIRGAPLPPGTDRQERQRNNCACSSVEIPGQWFSDMRTLPPGPCKGAKPARWIRRPSGSSHGSKDRGSMCGTTAPYCGARLQRPSLPSQQPRLRSLARKEGLVVLGAAATCRSAGRPSGSCEPVLEFAASPRGSEPTIASIAFSPLRAWPRRGQVCLHRQRRSGARRRFVVDRIDGQCDVVVTQRLEPIEGVHAHGSERLAHSARSRALHAGVQGPAATPPAATLLVGFAATDSAWH